MSIKMRSKRASCILLMLCMVFSLMSMTAFAAPTGPEITMQPQSPNYPEYSIAVYTVKASGKNLSATWFMEWLGDTYNISDTGGSMQPWEPFAGQSYGPVQLDDNTFTYRFEGIEYDLDGARIWCVIEDGHNDVASQKVRISIGFASEPPIILGIPDGLVVEQGEEVYIRCVAKSPSDAQLTFLWYETDTGKMEDIRAVNRGTETSDSLLVDTSSPGIRNYVCLVETTDGGLAWSSIVPVTVTEKTAKPEPTTPPTTAPKPPATSPKPSTSTQKPSETTPATQAPTPATQAPTPETQPPTPPTQATIPATTAPTEATQKAEGVTQVPVLPETTKPTHETKENDRDNEKTGLPWWTWLLVGLTSVSVGVAVTVVVVLVKQKKK